MTQLAIITDVHADVHALRDALAQIDKLGIETIVCAGDVLDYGLFPEETLTILRERKITCVRGNHDRWAVNEGHDMSGWDLTSRSIAWLDAQPTYWRKLIDGVRVMITHARPESDMKGIDRDAPERELKAILADAGCDVLIVGHTHVPFVRRLGVDRLVANPGALLREPAPGVEVATPGTFGLLEISRGSATFEIRRAATGEIVFKDRARRSRRAQRVTRIANVLRAAVSPQERPHRRVTRASRRTRRAPRPTDQSHGTPHALCVALFSRPSPRDVDARVQSPTILRTLREHTSACVSGSGIKQHDVRAVDPYHSDLRRR